MEDNLIESIDKNKSGELPTAIRTAHPEAKKLLTREAINPEDFIGVQGYDDNKVRRDIAIVSDLEKKFDPSSAKKAAEVLEAIMINAELNNWFGQDSGMIKTSAFDDYINGVDMVAEFEQSKDSLAHLGLAIDVTFGTRGISEKFSRIKKEIDSGQLAQIKYFYSENEGIRSPRKNLPRVVVGVEWDMIAELAGMWTRKENGRLSVHSAQIIILEEARLQLKTFREYAERQGKNNLLSFFDKDLAIIEKILLEKKDISQKVSRSDSVFRSISESVKTFS